MKQFKSTVAGLEKRREEDNYVRYGGNNFVASVSYGPVSKDYFVSVRHYGDIVHGSIVSNRKDVYAMITLAVKKLTVKEG